MKTKLIYFVHGTTYDNASKKCSGWKQVELTELGKAIGIVAHRAPQLAFEVITKNISWEKTNENAWRKTGDWQPGWEYNID